MCENPLKKPKGVYRKLTKRWTRFWMRFAGLSPFGRFATRLASCMAPPHYFRESLAAMTKGGYIAPSATVFHADLVLGAHVFIDDRCMIFQNKGGGPVELGDKVRIYRDSIIETGQGGYVSVGPDSSIHPRCQLNAYLSPIQIGRSVMIAANCAFYSYGHGIAPNEPISDQPLRSKGGIAIGDGAWFGTGAIVLSGVTIGKGAVVGAGSVVTGDVPNGAVALGNPARVVRMRGDVS